MLASRTPALGELLRKGLAIGELLRKGVKAEVPTDCRIQLIIAELVWRIAELGHGGMLIVTDRPGKSGIVLSLSDIT